MSGGQVEPRFKDMSTPKAKARKRIPFKSAKRMTEQDRRDACRAAVLDRSGGECEYIGVMPEVACGPLYGRTALEVDEIRGGSFRCTEMYDPDRCMAGCPTHHRVKTLNKREVIRRMDGQPFGDLDLRWL